MYDVDFFLLSRPSIVCTNASPLFLGLVWCMELEDMEKVTIEKKSYPILNYNILFSECPGNLFSTPVGLPNIYLYIKQKSKQHDHVPCRKNVKKNR